MKIAVFDTHVTRPDGRRMHFDILVPRETGQLDAVLNHGRRYLAARNIPPQSLVAEECRYCHIETATEEMLAAIDESGFAIIELAHCETEASEFPASAKP